MLGLIEDGGKCEGEGVGKVRVGESTGTSGYHDGVLETLAFSRAHARGPRNDIQSFTYSKWKVIN